MPELPPDQFDSFEDNVNDNVEPTFNDNEEEQQLTKLETLAFEDGSELVSYFDPDINAKKVTLYKWQVEVNEQLAFAKGTSIHPFKFVLCAANGSGKDAFVIAPFALWFILTKIEALVVITSSSGVQLTNQTEKYIRNLGNKINAHYKDIYGYEILKIKQRSIKCRLSGSEIVLFATDEEGKAEGYHPIRANGEMAIIINEAKSIDPAIYRALRRCTGYNYWINVSTPGLVPAGDFYNSWLYWPNKRKVTYFDCPRHHSPDEFEQDKRELGEHSALFRSKWLAEFTSVDGETIIPRSALERLRNKIKTNQVRAMCQDWKVRVGVDLAAGGDEVSVAAFRGNKQIAGFHWREKDTTYTVDQLERVFNELGLPKDYEYIFLDDGGIGRAIIDMLRRRGWVNLRRVLNQSAAKNKLYRNKGAEMWYNFRRLVEEGIIILIDDDKTYSQLETRRYKKSEEQAVVKIQLEPKAAAKAEGMPSPDRADAVVLAFCGLTYNSFFEAEIAEQEYLDEKMKNRYTLDGIKAAVEDMAFNDNFPQKKCGPIKGSLAVHIKNARYSYYN